MDTTERQHVRQQAYEMEATYKSDEKALKDAQQNAHHVIEGLKEAFPNETDETLCCIARAISQTVARLGYMPLVGAGDSIEAMCASYPLAAAALIGVYTLPEHKDCELIGTPAPAVSSESDKDTGMYL